MTAAALAAQLRSRGVRLRVVGDTVQVAPRAALTDADRAALREHLVGMKALLQAEADPYLALVREVFAPGAGVGAGQAAVRPPAPLITVDLATEQDPLVLLAARTGWPCVPLRRRLTILGTDWSWARFAATASRVDRARAQDYLERLPAAVPLTAESTRPAVPPPINPFAAATPTVPCPLCGESTWHRAGDGWACSTCHPSPSSPDQEAHQHEPGILRDTVRCPACAGPEGPRA
jgi:hypothetical protein